MKKSLEAQEAFKQKFPEAGEANEGVYLTGEQARQFSEIIGDKIFALSRKPELTNTEKTFIDTTMDIAARSIVYATERHTLSMVDGHAAHATASAVAKLEGIAHLPIDQLPNALGGVTGSKYSIRDNPAQRVLIEDAAGYSMQLFGQMAEAAEGIEVDHHLEGNLQNIIAHFEQVDLQPDN